MGLVEIIILTYVYSIAFISDDLYDMYDLWGGFDEVCMSILFAPIVVVVKVKKRGIKWNHQ